MSNKRQAISSVRGMPDVLPKDVKYWHIIENVLHRLTASYGYTEIKLPIIESTELFARGVGDTTDIVEKEMYTFSDRNGDSLTLRPEGTAGAVRAGIEHSLFYGETPKLWYYGPMFRHERPQKGRYRQFYQFGMEAFGVSDGYIDAEILTFCHRFWQNLGLQNKVRLEINCLGTAEVRVKFREALTEYFTKYLDQLDEDSKRRLQKNPLRILDSKNPDLKEIILGAPKLTDYLDETSKNHMLVIYNVLDSLNISYKINPHLVRGLDYYCLTVFEWVTDELGSQGTVCAGGRYDSLVAEIGGQDTKAIGMSIGIERLVLLLQQLPEDTLFGDNLLDAFIAPVGTNAIQHALISAEKLRDALPDIKLNVNTTGQAFKNQLKKADKSGAKFAIIIGDDEVEKNIFTVKWLREEHPQAHLTLNEVINLLRET